MCVMLKFADYKQRIGERHLLGSTSSPATQKIKQQRERVRHLNFPACFTRALRGPRMQPIPSLPRRNQIEPVGNHSQNRVSQSPFGLFPQRNTPKEPGNCPKTSANEVCVRSRHRTYMALRPMRFKRIAYTNSATRTLGLNHYSDVNPFEPIEGLRLPVPHRLRMF